MWTLLLLLTPLLQDDPPDPGKSGKIKHDAFVTKIPRQKGGDAEAEIHHPTEGKGPFPTIVLSPGGNAGTYRGYGGFGKWFASFGYITVIVAFNNDSAVERGKQYSEVLDWLEKKNKEEGWKLQGKIDTKKFVACGHSRGGFASVVAAKREKRFIACLAWAPSGPDKPEGENDPIFCLISGDKGDDTTCTSIFKQVNKPKCQVIIAGMDHFFSPREAAILAGKYSVAFLEYKVRGDKRYKKYFTEKADGVTIKLEEPE